MTFVSVTRMRLRSPLYLPQFWLNVFLSTWQAINTKGFKGGKLLADANRTYWTMTAWEEQAAMKIYRNAGAHRSVMPKIKDWCDEASAVHWRQEGDNLPDWIEVHQRLIKDGFLTKLSHPSPDHLTRNIAKPQSSRKGTILHPRFNNARNRVSSGDVETLHVTSLHQNDYFS